MNARASLEKGELVIRLEAGGASQEHRCPIERAEQVLRALEPLVRSLRRIVKDQRAIDRARARDALNPRDGDA